MLILFPYVKLFDDAVDGSLEDAAGPGALFAQHPSCLFKLRQADVGLLGVGVVRRGDYHQMIV